jgi:MarR family transcriptional regulator for hemolysin
MRQPHPMPKPSAAAPFDPLGRQLNVAARNTRGLLDSVLADAGTTFSSWLVLAAISARGPSIQKDLARELDMIGPSIVERLDQLEAAGHVLRSPVPGDRRAYLISLTPEGQQLFKQLNATMRATEAALVDGLDPRDIETTRRVLAHIVDRARELRAKT